MRIELQNAVHGYEDVVRSIEIIILEELKKCNSEEYYQVLLSDIKKQGITYTIYSTVQRNALGIERFYYQGSISDFIIKNRAKELIDLIKPIYIRELALYRLISEGYLMPVGLRSESDRISVDMNFSSEARRENLPVYVYLDMMPFGKYVVVKVPSKNAEVVS